MNIVIVLHSFAKIGGVERVLIDKANYLCSLGHIVTLVTYEQGQHPIAYKLNASVKHIDLNCRHFLLYRYPLALRLYKEWKLKKLFKKKWNRLMDEICPDIVVVTTYSDDFMSEILSTHRKFSVIVESHTAFVHDFHSDQIIKKIRLCYYLNTLKKCDLMIALTEKDAEHWRKYIKNVKVIANPTSFYCDDVEHLKKENGRILCVGRLEQQKRHDRLIEAFALIADKYKSWHIDIFGSGGEQSKLEKLIYEYGLEGRVCIHPPTDNIMNEYKRSQMFVLASDYEGFALVLLEAMACGLPVVSTDCPYGPSDIIEDGVTGLLAQMDVQDLASKMDWIISHEQERMEMGRNAHGAAKKYKWDNIMKKWEKAYSSLLFEKKHYI